ncbi:hypothetical protein OPIT5_12410 [Opitutaceae bacterium TAV5]|nr:hypothetical protein OPIT5_12410 [Opitutaceae bacterium TAV5]
MKNRSDSRAVWLCSARPGRMFHYLDKPASSKAASATPPGEWNRRVDSLDVPRFVRLVRQSGA